MLAKWIGPYYNNNLKDKVVLQLGAGCGLTGMCSAVLGKTLLLAAIHIMTWHDAVQGSKLMHSTMMWHLLSLHVAGITNSRVQWLL